ncbi:MAG: ABC transporter substrate binding protein [Pseudomonadota bacterium]
MRRLYSLLILFSLLPILMGCHQSTSDRSIRVAVVLPMELPSMDQVVAGFETQLKKAYPGNVDIIVKNARNNPQRLKSLVAQFNQSDIDVIVPIGLSASRLAVDAIQQKPIIAIAASDAQLSAGNHKNLVILQDMPSPQKQLQFIHAALPTLKYLTLIHSDDPFIIDQVQQLNSIAGQYGITIENLAVKNRSDIYRRVHSLNPHTQAMYMLQDPVVMGGISPLVKQAEAQYIPLIASDNGSVQNGAAFALGVKQYDVGIAAANLLLEVLNKQAKPAKSTQVMENYTVFVNSAATAHQGFTVDQLEKAAKALAYPIVVFRRQ